MTVKERHPWYLTPEDALALQQNLSRKVDLRSHLQGIDKIRSVGGVDVHFSGDEYFASVTAVVFSFPELRLIEKVKIKKNVGWHFPYVPGLLSFREGPLIVSAFEKIKKRPDVFLFDGQGIAHPKRMGLAAHMGILFDLPAIGCAKSLLYGIYEEPVNMKGAWTFLKDGTGELIGAVLRTRRNVKPLFVSQGYKIDLELSLDVVLGCCSKFRIPEPLRIAHSLCKGEKLPRQ